jgi:hypothetical protein
LTRSRWNAHYHSASWKLALNSRNGLDVSGKEVAGVTVDCKVGSWFTETTGVPAQASVIQRVCARAAPEGTVIHVSELPLGGVQVWADETDDRWSVQHRMARELRLAGWHTESGSDRLLVLGWSVVCLSHRVRMLSAALAGRLADFDQTAVMAVMVANQLMDEKRSLDEIATEVESRLRRALRWPARLSDLDGLDRTASLEPLRLRLAQIAGLEAKVARRCAEHLALAVQVAVTLAGGEAPPRHRTTNPGPTLTERVVAASVPNNSAADTIAEPEIALSVPSYAGSSR